MGTAWERLAALEGGTVVGLATTTMADSAPVVFAATPVGVFRSTDAGRSWEPLGVLGSRPGVEVVVPSPQYEQNGIVYTGAHDGLHVWRPTRPGGSEQDQVIDGNRAHESTGGGGGSGAAGSVTGHSTADGGPPDDGSAPDDVAVSEGHWQHLLTGSRVLALACSSSADGASVLLAGTEDDGVLVSRDGGRTWTGANPGLLDLTILALTLSPDFEHDGLGLAATPSGLYRTRNGAESWRMVDTGGDDVAIQCLALSPAFEHDRLILAGAEEQGLLRSDDGGRTWETVADLEAGSVNGIAFSAGDLVAAATDAGVALSQDGGASWRLAGEDLGSVLSVAILRDGDVTVLLAALPEGGVARSVDLGQRWAAANGGLTASLLTDLAISPAFAADATLVAAGAQAGILISADGGHTWSACNAGIEGRAVLQVTISPEYAHDGTLFAVTDGGLYVSRDRAERWEPVPPLDDGPSAAIAGPALAARVVAAIEGIQGLTATGAGRVTVLAALLDGRLAVSEDSGATWRSLATPFGTAEVVALARSPEFVRDGTLYVATAGPLLGAGHREIVVWRSPDDGRRWDRWLEERGTPPVCLAALPPTAFGDTLAVGLGGRVLRPRRDAHEVRGGIRRPLWQETALPDTPAIAGLAVSPDYRRDRTLFAATSAGVYVSRDGGGAFSAWRDGLVPPSIVTVAPSPVYADDRLVYALGLGGAIWRRRDA